MPKAERDVIKPPNQGQFKTNDAMNGSVPLTRTPSPAHPPNLSRLMHGDPGSSADLAHRPTPIDPPNASKFRGGDKGMSLDDPTPAAVEPGKAVVPTNPYVEDAALLGRAPSRTLQSK